MAAPMMTIMTTAAPVMTSGMDLIRAFLERILACVVKTSALSARSGRKNGTAIRINSKIWVLKYFMLLGANFI